MKKLIMRMIVGMMRIQKMIVILKKKQWIQKKKRKLNKANSWRSKMVTWILSFYWALIKTSIRTARSTRVMKRQPY